MAYSARVRRRPISQSLVLAAGLLLAACGGGSDSSTAPISNAADSTVSSPDAPTTHAATTVASTAPPTTAPPTTLPPTIDLTTLPGLFAVIAASCSAEEFVPQNVVENFVVCTLNPDGTNAKLVSLPGETPSGLAFTRGGTHLWYGDRYTRFGYVIDLTSGEHRERKRYEPLRSGVSPDGQLLLFIDPYTYVLTIAHADGSTFPDGSSSLTVADDTHAYYTEASWAPDSMRFVYLSTNDGNGGELECPEVWVGAIDGRAPAQITHFAGNSDGAEGCPQWARWSPTDDQILLYMVGTPAFTVENLYVINADGSNLTALTHGLPVFDPSASSPYGSVGSSNTGDWSPDGKYIVFNVVDGDGYRLAVMNSDGSQVTPITAAPLGIVTRLVAIRWSQG